jgi:hypothetical protein
LQLLFRLILQVGCVRRWVLFEEYVTLSEIGVLLEEDSNFRSVNFGEKVKLFVGKYVGVVFAEE